MSVMRETVGKALKSLKEPLLLHTPQKTAMGRRQSLPLHFDPDDTPMSPNTRKPYSRDCYFKMLIIGVGYLFPMCAVFAAFDYWKMLFVEWEHQIEFDIMVVYQSTSVLTVFLLSLVSSMDMHLRIVGGFVGQFICLAMISSFPLLALFLSPIVLYYTLMSLTFMMAIATGFLDSALLCFNSQYSPRMQEALQIGIGCSIFASVIYRDITKMIGSSIVESSVIYFICSLLTVLACLWNYISLLRHPVSWPIRASSVFRGGVDDTHPLSMGDNLPHISAPSLREVLSKCWRNQLIVFLHFAFCSFGYPAMITAIPLYSSGLQDTFLGRDNWYQALLLTVFTIMDTISRFGVRFRFGFDYRTFFKSVIIRAVLIPLLWLAASGGAVKSDLFSVFAVIVFGLFNGYCISLSLILMNEIKGMSSHELAIAGRFSAVSVNSGLCVGGIIASVYSKYCLE
jgi:solute carrier family 29 (equilibrative nucleoside transporter), member 1/2/3